MNHVPSPPCLTSAGTDRYLGLQTAVDEAIIGHASGNSNPHLGASFGVFSDYTGGIAISTSHAYTSLCFYGWMGEFMVLLSTLCVGVAVVAVYCSSLGACRIWIACADLTTPHPLTPCSWRLLGRGRVCGWDVRGVLGGCHLPAHHHSGREREVSQAPGVPSQVRAPVPALA